MTEICVDTVTPSPRDSVRANGSCHTLERGEESDGRMERLHSFSVREERQQQLRIMIMRSETRTRLFVNREEVDVFVRFKRFKDYLEVMLLAGMPWIDAPTPIVLTVGDQAL